MTLIDDLELLEEDSSRLSPSRRNSQVETAQWFLSRAMKANTDQDPVRKALKLLPYRARLAARQGVREALVADVVVDVAEPKFSVGDTLSIDRLNEPGKRICKACGSRWGFETVVRCYAQSGEGLCVGVFIEW